MDFIRNLWQIINPSYLKVGAIVVLLFLLVISLAGVRKYFVTSSLKGVLVGLFFGLLLTLLLEGFLLIGGKTAITEILGWRNAPKPIKTALDLGRDKLINVLGVTFEEPTASDAINILQSLNPTEIKKIKAIICTQ